MSLPGPMDRARVWRDLRAWIDQHEMADRESVTSILTVEQQLLINGLLSSQDNSESDDQNYIGKLHELIQKHKLPFPEMRQEEANSGKPADGWLGYCRLPWCDETFPQDGYGHQPGETPRSFGGKMAAKQFAAKQALQFMLDQFSATGTSTGTSATTAGSALPSNKRPRSDQSLPARNTDAPSQPSQPSNTMPPKKQKSVESEVRTLAARLNLKTPCYRTWSDKDDPNQYRGEVFWVGEPLAPPDGLGSPSQLFATQEEAEGSLARAALKWMQELMEKREELFAKELAEAES